MHCPSSTRRLRSVAAVAAALYIGYMYASYAYRHTLYQEMGETIAPWNKFTPTRLMFGVAYTSDRLWESLECTIFLSQYFSHARECTVCTLLREQQRLVANCLHFSLSIVRYQTHGVKVPLQLLRLSGR